jgi:CheY-like chemotaxis protein
METHVTVVDDDPIALVVASLVLKKIPNITSVKTFTEGEEALDFLKKVVVNWDNQKTMYVFLDLNMPMCDGWEIVEKIAATEHLSVLKLVLLSSSIDPEDQIKAKTYSQIISFLPKPMSKEAIIKLIQ